MQYDLHNLLKFFNFHVKKDRDQIKVAEKMGVRFGGRRRVATPANYPSPPPPIKPYSSVMKDFTDPRHLPNAENLSLMYPDLAFKEET